MQMLCSASNFYIEISRNLSEKHAKRLPRNSKVQGSSQKTIKEGVWFCDQRICVVSLTTSRIFCLRKGWSFSPFPFLARSLK